MKLAALLALLLTVNTNLSNLSNVEINPAWYKLLGQSPPPIAIDFADCTYNEKSSVVTCKCATFVVSLDAKKKRLVAMCAK